MEIRLGHQTYRVIENPLQQDEGRCGVTYKEKSEIHINPHIGPDSYRDTLFHEVGHAVANFVGIGDEDRLNEEEWISRTFPALLSVMMDNPDFVEAIGL